MDINKILEGAHCECGKFHECAINYVYVERGAASHIPEVTNGYETVLIVADSNTYMAGGAKCEEYLAEKVVRRVIFPSNRLLIPNEAAIEKVTSATAGADIILGIGSGVIQDLCKYVSHTVGIPYIVFATAPSMDGYASTGAAMITDGMKVTYPAGVPIAILADTEILKNAPLEMIKAGYGDIIGKYSALSDWKLGAAVNGEYFCPYVYDLTYDMLKRVLPLASRLLNRDEESVKTLMEALILVGIAMSFAGSSRPASGSEHHLSHYFEITGIVDGKPYLPHGIDVVFSTYVTAKIRRKIASSKFPASDFRQSPEELEAEIKRVYKSVGDGCLALHKKLGTYEDMRSERYRANEKEIKKILRECPTPEKIEQILLQIGLDINDFYRTYGEEKISDAVRYAKDLKDRYTVLWMHYDIMGLADWKE